MGLCSTGIDLACFKRNQYVINIQIPSKFGKDQIVNGRFLEMNQTFMDI